MHEGSRVILRLLSVGKRANEGMLPDSDGIVLWCRLYDSEAKQFRPYVCLGRVGYHSHVPGTRPVQFVWNLLDFEKMAKGGGGNDKICPSKFDEIIGSFCTSG